MLSSQKCNVTNHGFAHTNSNCENFKSILYTKSGNMPSVNMRFCITSVRMNHCEVHLMVTSRVIDS